MRLELARKVRHPLETELEADGFDRTVLFQHAGRKSQPHFVQPRLWAASE
jgi:hypothetical protein